MSRFCNTGILIHIRELTQDKPWFTFNNIDFIRVNDSPKKAINRNNAFSIAQGVAEKLNKDINNGIKVGEFFSPMKRNGEIGVFINPSDRQLALLNGQENLLNE